MFHHDYQVGKNGAFFYSALMVHVVVFVKVVLFVSVGSLLTVLRLVKMVAFDTQMMYPLALET